uniref:Branched-chain-amino-acid transaminase n=2 Tax=Phaeomonas parva TaxID=124430 RepID=A0A6U4DUP7_9STRA|mmetsp:Transcript_18014/g.55152  ORF Transcript_18014/g.55152 Transcript_18014/m.55152 type:complete len:451 (+) Transcript_18014:640-1992(+)
MDAHSYLTQYASRPPVVVCYEDLVAMPRETMQAMCEALGVAFDEAMMSWPAGPKPCDGLWAQHWYDSVHKSTCFDPQVGKKRNLQPLSPELKRILRAAVPAYQYLREHALDVRTWASKNGASVNGTVVDHGMAQSLYPDARNHDVLAYVASKRRGGGLVPRALVQVSAFDSAVQGGDAVWEGLRVYDGRIFKFEAHLDRLFDSARAMDFKDCHTREEVRDAVIETLAANGMRDGVHIRLTLTRGEKTTSSMNPMFNVFGTTLIVLAEWKPVVSVATYDNKKGVSLITATQRRNPPMCVDSKIHHNNLINNILPKIQANLAGAADALMLDIHGFVAETNATNVFLVKRGAVHTPTGDACLPGITRGTVLRLARELGYEVYERNISLAEFHAADEVFTTGTMGELTPVTTIDGRRIGDPELDAAGPVTRDLQQHYARLPAERPEMSVPLPEF